MWASHGGGLRLKEFKLSEQFVYYEGDGYLIIASLDPKDDLFLKISGPASRVVPLIERGMDYESIASHLQASFKSLDRKLIDANLPKVLDYLVECGMVHVSRGTRRRNAPTELR